MRRIVVLALIACSAVLAEPASILLPADGLYRVAPDRAGLLFRQCSRSAPDPGVDLWLPSSSEIAALETTLRRYLAERKAARLPTPPEQVEYGRQYVGYTRNGMRHIYGNFFPRSLWSPADPLSQHLPNPAARPVVICDGGPSFWGIVYKPATNTFDEPAFNGPL